MNIEPKESSHKNDLQNVKFMICKLEELEKNLQNKEYKGCENIGNDILLKSPDFTKIKIIIIQSMLNNVKIADAMAFINSKVSNEEKDNSDEFNYYLALACYYDGKYEKAKQIMKIIKNRNEENPKFTKLFEILQIIEVEKEKCILFINPS